MTKNRYTFDQKVAALTKKYSKRTRFDYYCEKAVRELWLFLRNARDFIFMIPKGKSDKYYKLLILTIIATPISLWALALIVLVTRW